MPRYDIVITMVHEHHMVEEAPTALEAQTQATAKMADRDPEKLHIDIVVEKGAV